MTLSGSFTNNWLLNSANLTRDWLASTSFFFASSTDKNTLLFNNTLNSLIHGYTGVKK